jgi:hypothetical protein
MSNPMSPAHISRQNTVTIGLNPFGKNAERIPASTNLTSTTKGTRILAPIATGSLREERNEPL